MEPELPALEKFVEKSQERISRSSIGFLRLDLDTPVEDAFAIGSGTLVSIGGYKGILTAAHVLDQLPRTGAVGIVQYSQSPNFPRKTTIEMSHTDMVSIGSGNTGADGPDLGFLKLPDSQVESLEVKSVFFNMDKRANIIFDDREPRVCFEGVSGMIGELAEDLPPEHGIARVKGFHGMFGVGPVSPKRGADGYDFVGLEVTYDEMTNPPASFGGWSGGGYWRVYVEQSGGDWNVTDIWLMGVCFFESKVINGERLITCHGPKSIYENLANKIRKQWPENN